MLPTAIGLSDNRSGVYAAIQDWCMEHGLGVYEPQRRHGEGDISQEWDAATETMRWKPATLAMMQALDYPLLWHVGSYHYATKPQILRNIMPQLDDIANWLQAFGINGWFLIDEPPHAAVYGWTPALQELVQDFVGTAQNAGIDVGVAMPGPTQLKFWKERINPTFWILNDKHSASVWRPILGTDTCWLYNAANFAGLGFRIQLIGAKGYLHWSGVETTKQNPLPIMFDAEGAPTPAVYQLINELTTAVQPQPETWQEGYAMLDARLKAGGL